MKEIEIPLLEPQYKLTRENDEMVKYSRDVMWLEWNEEGHWKDRHSEPDWSISTDVSIQRYFYVDDYRYR